MGKKSRLKRKRRAARANMDKAEKAIDNKFEQLCGDLLKSTTFNL